MVVCVSACIMHVRAEAMNRAGNPKAFFFSEVVLKAIEADTATYTVTCPKEYTARIGYLFRCGKGELRGEALESALNEACVAQKVTSLDGEQLEKTSWSSLGSGIRGTGVVFDGEYIGLEYHPDGMVIVQSARGYQDE